MDCWRDKMPDGKPVECGTFPTWADFLKWDGEKICNRFCPVGAKGRPSQSAKYSLYSDKAWMRQLGGGPAYRRQVHGRKVA